MLSTKYVTSVSLALLLFLPRPALEHTSREYNFVHTYLLHHADINLQAEIFYYHYHHNRTI